MKRVRKTDLDKLNDLANDYPNAVQHFLDWQSEGERMFSPDEQWIPAKDSLYVMMSYLMQLIFT